jgi:hypothetical protein
MTGPHLALRHDSAAFELFLQCLAFCFCAFENRIGMIGSSYGLG